MHVYVNVIGGCKMRSFKLHGYWLGLRESGRGPFDFNIAEARFHSKPTSEHNAFVKILRIIVPLKEVDIFFVLAETDTSRHSARYLFVGF